MYQNIFQRIAFISLAAVVLIGGFSYPATALFFGPAQTVVTDLWSSRPSVAVYGSNIYVAWLEHLDGLYPVLRFRRSLDNGVTWPDPPQTLSSSAGRPMMAVSGSSVFVIGEKDAPTPSDPYMMHGFFRRSPDRGKTFEAAQDIGPIYHISHIAMVSYDSNVYLAWFGYDRKIYFRKSLDGGATWNPPFSQAATLVATGQNIGHPLSLVVSGADVYVAWSSSNSLSLGHSGNGGLSFSAPQLLCNCEGGQLAVDGSTLYVLTSSGYIYTGSTVLFSHSLDHGVTWDPAFDSMEAEFSKHFVDPWALQLRAMGHTIYALWLDYGESEIRFRHSLDGGSHWIPSLDHEETKLSDSASPPEVAVSGTSLSILWSGSNNDKLFRSSADNGATWDPPLNQAALTVGNSLVTDIAIAAAGSMVYVAWPLAWGPDYGIVMRRGSSVCDQFVADVTYPSRSVVNAGAAFIKTWRFKNCGSMIWNGYTLYHKSGSQFPGISPVVIPNTPPGSTVDISVSLKAPPGPACAAREQRGVWQIRDSNQVDVFNLNGAANVIITVNPSSGSPIPNLASASYRCDGEKCKNSINPFVQSLNGGQCTAFAWGRANELKGISGLTTVPGSASQWWSTSVYPKGQIPFPNSIAVWGGNTTNSAGHVAYVELVNGLNLTINEANYSCFIRPAETDYKWGGGYDGAPKPITIAAMQNRPGAGSLLGYIYLDPPSVSAITPISGPAGTLVTITGSRFGQIQLSGKVTFGTVTATVQSWSDTQIKVIAPSSTGVVNIAVTTKAGTSNSKSFTYR